MANVIFEAGEGRYEAEPTADGFFNLNKFIEDNESVRPTKLSGKQYAPWIKANRIALARHHGRQYFVTKEVIEALIKSSLDERRKDADHVRVDVEPDSHVTKMFDAITQAIQNLGHRIESGVETAVQRTTTLFSPVIETLTDGLSHLTGKVDKIQDFVAEIDLKLDAHAEQIAGLKRTDADLAARLAQQQKIIEELKTRLDQVEKDGGQGKRRGWGF